MPKSCGFITFLKDSEALKMLVAADMVTKTIVDKIAIVASPTAFFFIRKIKLDTEIRLFGW